MVPQLPKGSSHDLEAAYSRKRRTSTCTLSSSPSRRKESWSKTIEQFRELAMRSRSGMTPETLVETCRHNFLTPILVQMGVVECKTWKQLQEHGQTAQEL